MKSMELDLAIIGGAAGLAAAAEAKRLLTTTVRTRGEPGEVVSGGDFRAGSQADPTRMHADDGWLTVKPPIRCGQVIVSNLLQSGKDLIPSDHLYHQKSVSSGNANFKSRTRLT